MNKKRQKIFDKSGGKCWYCGCELPKRWQVDHFHPVIRVNGKPLYPELDIQQNLVPSCAPCNNFKSSSSIEGFRWTINEQFKNTLKNSTGLRQLNRLGLIDMEKKPIKFWFEKQGITMPNEHELYGVSDDAKEIEWVYDEVEEAQTASISNYLVTARENNKGLLVIATTCDWEQERTIINGSKYNLERAAEWVLRFSQANS